MMKRTVTLLAFLAALCCLLTFSAAAESTIVDSGTCGENLTWTLDGEGTLRIAGEGAMEDFRLSAPWYQRRSSIKAVVIENGVTSIGIGAFYNCSGLSSITIPASVTSIGGSAFENCSSLTGINIPESVTSIGDYAFNRCDNLSDVYITDMDAWCRINFEKAATPMSNAKNIWLNGNKIVSVTVPEGVVSLDYTFYGFKDLSQVKLPESLTSIGDYAFGNCASLLSVNIPEGVTSIGYRAFYQCSNLRSVKIPSGATSIGKGAFSNCSSLTDIIIPAGVTSIENETFSRCSSLIRLTISEGVTNIGNSAFEGCSSLMSANIPEDVTTIGERAFSGCSSLNGITIPEGVTAIGAGAFANCVNLTSIHIPAGITTIEKDTFDECSRLESVTFAENSQLKTIGSKAFSGWNKLTSIVIPEGVVSIGSRSFSLCGELTSITIPASVTVIGDSAFYGCNTLTSVHITDLDTWCNIRCDAEEGTSPFYYATNLYLNGQLVESLEIPASVSVIQAGLFRNAKCLKRVSIPRSLAGVAANAFENCTNITEVFYEGSESEWANLPISAGNDPLKNAQVYFNSTLDDYYCRISVQVSSGGRITVDHAAARAGDTVTVTAAPYQGYELTAICVDGVEIEGNTFTVTGNHTVSAVFTRVPVVGGNEDFRLEGISVRTAAGEELQELPQGSLLVTVAVRHLNENGSGTILLAQYDSQGRYRGLMWLTLDEMPQGMTLRVSLPVDNSSGEIANLKVFVVEDLTSPLPVGTPVSFGQV